MKNIIITGGAGFIGSHLVNHLVNDRECNVIVVDNLITGQKKWINPKAKFIYHDITQLHTRNHRVCMCIVTGKQIGRAHV